MENEVIACFVQCNSLSLLSASHALGTVIALSMQYLLALLQPYSIDEEIGVQTG